MKVVARRLAWLLPLVLCACAHNPNPSQMQALAPPLEDSPPPPPDISPAALPAPAVNVPKTKEPVAIPEPVQEKPRHRKSAKTTSAAQANSPAGTPGQVADAAPALEESAIGKLETPPEAPDSRKQAENSIAEVERGLNGLARKLNDQETKTSVQIREFLTEARKALASGDIEGAKTLATKARTLLGELSQ